MIARILAGLTSALVLTGCGSSATGGTDGGGLFGTVRISPATPVCRTGSTCSRPARGFRLVFVRNGSQVAATTDRKGRYRISLERGRYAVRPARALKRGRLRPTSVTVPGGRAAKRDFTYDPGIR
jgi:hypothetical protein